jgi:hypothetical protein
MLEHAAYAPSRYTAVENHIKSRIDGKLNNALSQNQGPAW